MYQSLVDFSYWTFIAQILNLLITAAVFKRFLFEPVKKIIEQRQSEVNKIYEDAAESRKKADEDKESYEKLLSEARGEAAELVRSATVTAQQRGDELVSQARREVSNMKERAEADIAQERKKALNEVKNEISDIAMEIASKVVEREIRSEDHRELVDDFIEKLGEDA